MARHTSLTRAAGVRGRAGGCVATPADNDLVAADGSATLGPASVGLVAVGPGPNAVAVAELLATDSRLAQALGMALLPPDHDGSAYLAALTCWCAEHDAVSYAVTVSGDAVGLLSLSRLGDPDGAARIGYWLASNWWGQGVMSQAFALALAEVRRLGMRSVGGFVERGNVASERIWQHHHPTAVSTERGTECTVWL